MKYIKKLLGAGNKKQIGWGALFGTFLGLFLLLSAVQLYFDLQHFLTGSTQNTHYVSINKKVRLLDMLNTSPSFSQKEMDTLLQQDFIEEVGQFTANRFKVSASSSMVGFRTALFFEAVPDDYLDIPTTNFQWTQGQKEIPVIISRDYLALYNFGFAPSQGLPPITAKTITKVPVDVTITGRGRQQQFKGKIAGFSDRFNSILVPQTFMDWANQQFGNTPKQSISRLLLKTKNPYSKELEQFLQSKEYEVSRGKLIGGRVGVLLKVLIGIIAFIGLALVILSILLFLLHFELQISQSNKEIGLLLQLGYQPTQVSGFLFKRMITYFGAVLLIALITLAIVHFVVANWLTGQSIQIPAMIHWVVVVMALLIALLFGLYGKLKIQREVLALYN